MFHVEHFEPTKVEMLSPKELPRRDKKRVTSQMTEPTRLLPVVVIGSIGVDRVSCRY